MSKHKGIRLFTRMVVGDVRRSHHEQSGWRIRLFCFGTFLKQKVWPFVKWTAGMLFLAILLSSLFAREYAIEVSSLEVVWPQGTSPTWRELLWDSFRIFENVPLLTGKNLLWLFDDANGGLISDAVARTATCERVIGLVINSVFLAGITSVGLRSYNPIWIAPKVVVTTKHGGERRHGIKLHELQLRYWLRCTEDEWLHRFGLTVRMLSDSADRSIETESAPEYEYQLDRLIRRGVCKTSIDLFADNGQPFEIISKMVAATEVRLRDEEAVLASGITRDELDQDEVPPESFAIWSSKEGRVLPALTRGELRKFEDYIIQFRLMGTNQDSREFCAEKKYRIGDIMFDYSFVDVEVPRRNLPIHFKKRKYDYRYANVWMVRRLGKERQNPKVDMNTAQAGLMKTGLSTSLSSYIKKQNELLKQEDNKKERLWLSRACDADIQGISQVMAVVHAEVHAGPHPDWFIASSPKRVAKKLSADSYAYVAKDKDETVAYFIFQAPGKKNRADNLGYEIGLTTNLLSKVLVMDSVGVLPGYRGYGLMQSLLRLGEAEGYARGYRYFMATVHPNNKFSLDAFLAEGYRIVKTVSNMYAEASSDGMLSSQGNETAQASGSGGVKRVVLLKCPDLEHEHLKIDDNVREMISE